MRRTKFLGLAVLGAVAAGCGGISLFSGRINGAFFEPTGTVFAFVDQLSPAPQLATNPSSRFIASGVYAYFDAAQDQASQNGTNLAELKQEIANHDWISLEWANSNELEVGKTYKTTLIRTTEEPFFRVVDPSATDVTAGFTARVGFRRAPVRRNAPYTCPSGSPRFLCQDYRPFGTRAVVEVTLNSVNRALGAQSTLTVKVTVEKAATDPEDALTGTLSGSLAADTVSERVAETNLATLGLYALFNVNPGTVIP